MLYWFSSSCGFTCGIVLDSLVFVCLLLCFLVVVWLLLVVALLGDGW